MASNVTKSNTEAEEPKESAVTKRGRTIMAEHEFISFKDDAMVLVVEPYCHYVPLSKGRFDKIAYKLLDGPTRSMVADAYEYVKNNAPEMDQYGHLICFGITPEESIMHPELNGGDPMFTANNRAFIWDTSDLIWRVAMPDDEVVWRSPYPRMKSQLKDDAAPIPFILQLAGGDRGLYDDIMQSIAPMIMDKKPDGVIWWVGEGANGKSTLMNALYRLFPDQLTGLTVKALEDGRDTLDLNRSLANIVRESSEGRIEDTGTYKALGTHENFKTHVFRQQKPADVIGNIHSIFSANSVPALNDKGHSARRRTFIIPFTQTFEPDPDFERRTFTPEFFAQLVAEMSKYAVRLRNQGYRYRWSIATTGVKAEYDREAGAADEYAREMVNDRGLAAFDGYDHLKRDFDNWCAHNGYNETGRRILAKAMQAAGFERVATRSGIGDHVWRLRTIDGEDPLAKMGTFDHIGLYVVDGLGPMPSATEPTEEESEQTSILNKKW